MLPQGQQIAEIAKPFWERQECLSAALPKLVATAIPALMICQIMSAGALLQGLTSFLLDLYEQGHYNTKNTQWPR
jgi:hypothetical protein